MKAAFLVLIVFISYLGFKLIIPPVPLLTLYGVVVFLPVLFILVKKNMVNALLAWFFFLMFKYGLYKYGTGIIVLPLLPDIYIERLIWLALFFTFVAAVGLRQIKLDIGITGTEVAMFALCSYIVASMINAGTIYREGGGLTLNLLLQPYLIPFSIFFLAKYLLDDKKKVKKVLVFFCIIGFYLGVTAILEYFNLYYLVFPDYIGNPFIGVHWGRSRGPFLQAVINGLVINIIIFIIFYLLLQKLKTRDRILLSVTLIIMLIALLFTFSRAPWIGFILGSLLYPLFFRQARKVYFIGVVTVLILLITLFSADQFKPRIVTSSVLQDASLTEKISGRAMSVTPVYGRILLYRTAWRMFLDKPLFGFGYNTFKKYNYMYLENVEGIPMVIHRGINLHDTLAKILVELGLTGLTLVLVILISIFSKTLKLYRLLSPSDFQEKGFIVLFWSIAITFLFTMQTIDMHFFIFPISLFFLFAGIVCGLYQRKLQELQKG